MIYRFEVTRLKTIYNFKADMTALDSWDGDHNAKHNMEDYGALYRGDVLLWHAPMQTVANMPGVRHSDTIIPGQFFIKWDVPRRAFKGHIHGIVGALDQDGQQIDESSVETVPGKNGAPADWARWIFGHSTKKNDPAPESELTRFAWSAGCFITTPEKQDELFAVGTREGFTPGLRILCILSEK